MIAALLIYVELQTITAVRKMRLIHLALYGTPDHVTGIKIDDVIVVSKK